MRDALDAETVILRLEDAGRTLLSLPPAGARTRLGSAMPTVVHEAVEAYGWSEATVRPSVPSAKGISRMDEALGWILLIPLNPPRRGAGELWSTHGGAALRRIVGARCLVSPRTERHLFSWRRLGRVMSAHHDSVKTWHAQAIDVIVRRLNNRSPACEKSLDHIRQFGALDQL